MHGDQNVLTRVQNVLSLQEQAKIMKQNLNHTLRLPAGMLLLPALVVIFTLMSHPVLAQDAVVVKKITIALNNGNAADLAQHFSTTIDLSIPDNEGTYSKKQAEQLVKAFFEKQPPSSFTLEHQGNSNDGSTYLIGMHKTRTGKNFRVYVLIKSQADESLIQQLQFEAE